MKIEKMLKAISPIACNCRYLESKCAEIHYQTRNFSILCAFCGMKTMNYHDFVQHFERLHFNNVSETMPCTTISKNRHHDPLDFDNKVPIEDTDDLIKKLKGGKMELKDMKRETLTRTENTRSVEAQQKANEPDDNCDNSDNHYLFNKVQEDKNKQDTTGVHEPEEHIDQTLQSGDVFVDEESCEEEICRQEFPYRLQNSESELEISCLKDDENSNSRDTAQEEDIDWSKPYEPNLLKNHNKRPYKPRNKPNLCTYCGRTFKRRYQLETHLNVHTGEKPHQCEICGRLFRAITTLTRHLNTHEQRESFNCKFCKKVFTHKVALLSHELRHTQERIVPCSECDKWFYTENQMDTHKRKVHNKSDQDDLPFVCEICSKRYRSGSMLSTHKFKKHYRTAKFSCERCGKKFVDEQQLFLHKRIHIDGYSSLTNLADTN